VDQPICLTQQATTRRGDTARFLGIRPDTRSVAGPRQPG